MVIEFFVPWEVKPKQGGRSGRTKAGKYVHYQPKAVKVNQEALILLCSRHRPKHGSLCGPIKAEYTFQYRWRKGDSAAFRSAGHRMKDTSPDSGNLIKQLEDCLEKAGFFFVGDGQIADTHIRKVWTDSPGVQIRLEEMN